MLLRRPTHLTVDGKCFLSLRGPLHIGVHNMAAGFPQIDPGKRHGVREWERATKNEVQCFWPIIRSDIQSFLPYSMSRTDQWLAQCESVATCM